MRNITISLTLIVLSSFALLAGCHKGAPASPPSTSSTPTAVSPPAFPNSWDGVHQFVVGDTTIPMPQPTANVPPMIAELLQPGAATMDFVWAGDSYANCWAGDPSCINLPANSQHPIIGHYIPFAGIQMLANYARCLDQSDCNLVSNNYECKPLRLSETASGPFKPRVTYTLNVYTDAADNPENVCQPKSVPPGTPPIPFVNSVQARKIEFSYWRRAKPGWLLYWKKDDTTPESLAWISGSLPLDVSNPDVAAEVLGRIRRWPYLKEYYGAISLDTVGLATPYTVMYRCRKGGDEGGCTDGNGWEPLASGQDPVNHGYGKQCLGGYCYPAWTSLVLNWVTTMRDTAHTLGLNLVINVSYGGDKSAYPYAYIPADDQKLLQLFDTVDGVFDEGGFTSGNLQATVNGCVPMWTFNWNYTCGSKTETQNRWSNFSRYLLAVQARGKPYFSKNATPGPGNLLIPPKPEPQPQAQAVPWSLASFLVSRGTSPSLARQAIYMAEDTPGKGDNLGLVPYGGPLYMALNPPIGHPCQDPQTPQVNVFTRQFSGGLVMVNANQPGGPSAPINLPVPYNDVIWPAAAPTSLAAGNGAVILVASGRLCGS